MSKKKKKHPTNNNKKKTAASTPQKNALTIVLSVLVAIATITSALLIFINPFQEEIPTAPVVPVEQNPAGNDVEDMKRYLDDKYGLNFEHVDSTNEASLFAAPELSGLVACYRREVVQSFDENRKHLFTDIYVDNAYMLVNQAQAAEYYQSKLSVNFGNCKFMTYIDILANPSSVGKNTPYTTYIDIVKNLSVPDLIILTDKQITEEEKGTIASELKALGYPITVRVFTCAADMQSKYGPGDIMQFTASDKDVQYYDVFNADHLYAD